MSAIYAFGLLILLAFLGTRFLIRKRSLSALNYLFLSGFVYIFLGLYLGHHGLNVLSAQVLEALNPLISLGLGWIGFVFGFQLERKYLKRFSKKDVGLSVLKSLFVFVCVYGLMLLCLVCLFPEQPSYLLFGMALAFALLATVNSPTLLNAACFVLPARGDYFYMARFLTSVSGFWGIIGLSLLFSFWHFPFFESHLLMRGALLLLASTLVPVCLGVLFHFLTKSKTSEQEILVYVLGLVFFVSGAAFFFNLSPLYVSMIMGIVFSNLTRIQEKLYPLLLSTEKPIYIIFLILIGALWEFRMDWNIVLLVAVFVLARIIGYTLPLPLCRLILRYPNPLPPVYGLSFLSFGGIGVAVAVSLKLAYTLELMDVFLSVALLAVIINELISPKALQKAILKLDSPKTT
jgi:hypothetical protein